MDKLTVRGLSKRLAASKKKKIIGMDLALRLSYLFWLLHGFFPDY